MNTTVEEARALVQVLLPELASVEGAEVVVAPPFVSLAAVAELTRGSRIWVSAQNMHHEEKGAFTGEVSPLMLQGLCKYVILGHSERRMFFHEDDAVVARKTQSALEHGLLPIVCVGENAEDRRDERAAEVVSKQVQEALWAVPFDPGLVIAYEPVWAIGTGAAATGEMAEEMCALIREELAKRYSAPQAEDVRILYGGSVTAANIKEFVAQANVDGALVGGASLRAPEFAGIVRATAEAVSGKR